jgi:UDP-N-acetylmuramoyl-tripeptide--D-alanyl-D-alanine ligase
LLAEAVSRGAAGCVVAQDWVEASPGKVPPVPVIVVSDTVYALGRIAHAHRMKFTIPVIGVTGSNGKTTTKEMIAAILGAHYNVLKSQGSFNNHIGVPLSLLGLTSFHTAAVLELGMNHKGEIRGLAAIAVPTIAVITNAAGAHLEFFNSPDEIIEAKCELLERLGDENIAVINADCEALYAASERYTANQVGFGFKKGCRYRATNVVCHHDGVAFTLNEQFTFRLHVLGEHNVYNALAAIAVGDFLGVPMEMMRERLSQFQPVSLRMETVNCNGVRIIADCYNANPHSMAAAIRTLTAVADSARKIVVFGDMRELGSASVEQHRYIGQLIAEQRITFLLTVGREAAHAAEAAAQTGMDKKNIFVFSQTDEAAQCLAGLARPGDVVLLKGSRAMKIEQVLKHMVAAAGGCESAPGTGPADKL